MNAKERAEILMSLKKGYKQKQTAIDWLCKHLITSKENDEFNNLVIQKAKEIEKQQIIDAHGNQKKKSGGVSNYLYILTGEKYYNENYE